MTVSSDNAAATEAKWKRPPAQPGVYGLAAGTLAALLLIFVVAPIVQWWAQPAPLEGRFDSRTPLSMMFQQGAMNGFTLVWFFAVGASFGSFMNVVVWRMPRGMNFVSQSSICPKCRHAIRGRHNLPILGWIALGGRCRDCGELISFRYPLVELVFGAAAFFLSAWELAGGGWNLPFAPPYVRSGFLETLWTPKWELILILACHFFLYVWVLTLCLFEFDEETAPRRFVLFAFLLAVLNLYACPVLHPVSWMLGETAQAVPHPLAPVRLNGVMGLVGGLLAAFPAALAGPRRALPINFLAAAGLAGGHLGWHAALSVVVMTNLMVAFLQHDLIERRGGFVRLAIFVMALTVQIAAWKWLHAWQWQSGGILTAFWLAIAAAAVFIAPLWRLGRR
jgi:leader peptidase (prepilin peptidase)/N-methyltransferase